MVRAYHVVMDLARHAILPKPPVLCAKMGTISVMVLAYYVLQFALNVKVDLHVLNV